MTREHVDEIVRKMERRVPVVRPDHYVFHGDPFYKGAYSTYADDRHTMYLRRDIDAKSVRHEHGHAFDYRVLRPEHRKLLLQWWGIPGRFWWWDADHDPMKPSRVEAGCEIFANVYARAAFYPVGYYRFKKLIRTAYKEAGLG